MNSLRVSTQLDTILPLNEASWRLTADINLAPRPRLQSRLQTDRMWRPVLAPPIGQQCSCTKEDSALFELAELALLALMSLKIVYSDDFHCF